MVRVLFVVEIGSTVGFGHVVRSSILRSVLRTHFDVDLWVIKRDGWSSGAVEARYLPSRSKYDLVICDGLSVAREVLGTLRYKKIISLSYISNINDICDLVVAPALHGEVAPDHYLTDLRTLIFRGPPVASGDLSLSAIQESQYAYISLGANDADGVLDRIETALEARGLPTRRSPMFSDVQSVESFIEHAFFTESISKEKVHLDSSEARVIVSQRGLSAVELSIVRKPILLRSRKGFTPAYTFLERLPWVRFIDDTSLEQGISWALEYRPSRALPNDVSTLYTSLIIDDRVRRRVWIDLLEEVQRRG